MASTEAEAVVASTEAEAVVASIEVEAVVASTEMEAMVASTEAEAAVDLTVIAGAEEMLALSLTSVPDLVTGPAPIRLVATQTLPGEITATSATPINHMTVKMEAVLAPVPTQEDSPVEEEDLEETEEVEAIEDLAIVEEIGEVLEMMAATILEAVHHEEVASEVEVTVVVMIMVAGQEVDLCVEVTGVALEAVAVVVTDTAPTNIKPRPAQPEAVKNPNH